MTQSPVDTRGGRVYYAAVLAAVALVAGLIVAALEKL